MAVTLPGTLIEVSEADIGSSRTMFDGIFASGGITLSQVCVMTGLEPYMVQNWVKRRFVSGPQKRMYSKNQFARIVIINMLRESLQIDSIIEVLKHINGTLTDESDDLISDSELYHKFVDMTAMCGGNLYDVKRALEAAQAVAADYTEPVPGARRRLAETLEIMIYARISSQARQTAERRLKALE
jgi:DNA-binding transcriptional MerR regulator